MRMPLQRIAEEDQPIGLAFGDPGAGLLVTAVRAAAKAGNPESELLLQQVTRSSPSRTTRDRPAGPRLHRAHSSTSRFLLSRAIRAIRRRAGGAASEGM
jgi:hypothetical protein